jgi:cytochrome c oxidase cbb3-type subunit 3
MWRGTFAGRATWETLPDTIDPIMKAVFVWGVCLLSLPAAAADTRVRLPNSRADLLHGQKLFGIHCARCHGAKAEGSRGPALNHSKLARASDDAALLDIIENGIRGTEMPGADAMDDREMRQTAAYVRSLGKIPAKPVPGDVAHGAEIYRGKGGCTGCHSVSGQGSVGGPDLTTIGTARGAAHLREALIDPSASVPEGYLLVTVATKSGSRVTGVRVNEDSFSIQVRDNTGRTHSFWKSDVESVDKQRGKSAMPSYKDTLSEAELTDVVAYLASLKEKK